jgi:hypothetical protein
MDLLIFGNAVDNQSVIMPIRSPVPHDPAIFPPPRQVRLSSNICTYLTVPTFNRFLP